MYCDDGKQVWTGGGRPPWYALTRTTRPFSPRHRVIVGRTLVVALHVPFPQENTTPILSPSCYCGCIIVSCNTLELDCLAQVSGKDRQLADQPGTTVEWNGLKIIGAGFGRTGTLSLKNALEQLGFVPCYHMTELFFHPEANDQWVALVDGEPVSWSTVFNGYQATVDWPACAYYKELMQAYPEARVLLSVRDPEKWYESVINTIYQVSRRDPSSPHARMIRKLIWDGTFHGRFEDKAYAISVFQTHNEEVKRLVPPEKLLVYDVKEGWEPLCTFLGVPVPLDMPFPHLNDRQEFLGRIAQP